MKSSLTILHYVSTLCRFSVLPMFISLFSFLFQPQNYNEIVIMFFIALIILGLNILIAWLTFPFKNCRLHRGDDAIIVTLTWIMTIVFSAIPYLFLTNLTLIQALFESTSGWTTTGLSVINVDSASQTILLYRSLTQFFGGVGIVLIVFTFLSDSYGLKLYTQEGHNDRLLPNVLKSARLISLIYLGYVIFGILGYVVLGMGLFDAINISMAALSTGGFAPRSQSLAFYQSSWIEWFTMILMVLGATNFAAHMLLIKRQFLNFFKTSEFKLFVGVISLSLVFIFLSGAQFQVGVRTILFELISSITTTGFTTTSYSLWRPVWVLVLIFLMIIGGGSGSTAGGIKQSRVVAVIKSMIMHIRRYTLPRQVIKESTMHNSRGETLVIDKAMSLDASMYVLIYIIILVLGTLIIAGQGYSLLDSFFEFASSLGTVGTSVGIISLSASNIVLITSIIGMILGRLEILVVIAAAMTLKHRLFNA
jgi:trk system potassium uptake protein